MRLTEQTVFEIKDVDAIRTVEAVVITDDDSDRQRHWDPRVMNIFSGYSIPAFRFYGDRAGLEDLAARHAS